MRLATLRSSTELCPCTGGAINICPITMLLPLVLFALVSKVLSKEPVPVIIWGSYGKVESEGQVSALAQLHSYQFTQLVHKLITRRPHILLFTEENLSIEDFSWKDDQDLCSFPYLLNLSETSKDFLYLPSVESPVSVFHQLTHHGYSFTNYDEESPPLLSVPSILKVNLPEPGLSDARPTMLRTHDKFMARVAQEAINKYKKVLVAYTGRHASFIEPYTSRHRRDAEDDEDEKTEDIVMNDSNRTICLVAGAPIEFRKGDNVTYLTRVIYASIDRPKSKTTEDTITLDVKFEEEAISLDFTFTVLEDMSWSLDYIVVEESSVKMKTKTAIGGPGGYSFFCESNITFQGQSPNGEEYVLIIGRLQAQPRVINFEFGPANDCVPYFTSQIWSGLLVGFLLLGVAFIAIIFILEINTMDRFDDPKGKVLSIPNE